MAHIKSSLVPRPSSPSKIYYSQSIMDYGGRKKEKGEEGLETRLHLKHSAVVSFMSPVVPYPCIL